MDYAHDLCPHHAEPCLVVERGLSAGCVAAWAKRLAKWELGYLMDSAFGIPTAQALRFYKNWKAWDEDKEDAWPQSVLFGPPPKD